MTDWLTDWLTDLFPAWRNAWVADWLTLPTDLTTEYSIVWFTFVEIDACVPRKELAIQKNQKVLGVAIYFFTYSTWEGPVLYVEDLFVIPTVRGKLTGVRLRIRSVYPKRDQRTCENW